MIIAEDKTETLCFGDEGAPYQAKQLPGKERSKVPLPELLSPYRPARCQARRTNLYGLGQVPRNETYLYRPQDTYTAVD